MKTKKRKKQEDRVQVGFRLPIKKYRAFVVRCAEEGVKFQTLLEMWVDQFLED